MREYQVRRTAACPTGEHVHISDDPDDPTRQKEVTLDCTCPWLVIRESQPVPHMMVWSTRESVQRLIREFDQGHFDQEGMPRRARSQFMSPHVSDLLDLIDAGDVVGAAMRLLATVTADQVRWMADTSTLAIRVPFDKGYQGGKTMDAWLQLTFEASEPIKVNRGPLGEVPEPAGKLDLSQLAAIADGEPNVPAWELWRTKLTGIAAAAVLSLSSQAQEALVAAGVGWQNAPQPADGYHDPFPDEDANPQVAQIKQLHADAGMITAEHPDIAAMLADGDDEVDRFEGVLARGAVTEIHQTADGPVAVTTVGGQVVGVTAQAKPLDLAEVPLTEPNPYTKLFAEGGVYLVPPGETTLGEKIDD